MTDDFALFQSEIQKDPVKFYDHILGCSHWSKQDDITRAVFEYMRVSVASCHGIGKSYISARLALAFLFAHPDSVVITTAPTWRQVENVIWREINDSYAKAIVVLGGKMLKTSFEISDKWYAMGVSSNKPDNMQGIHAKYVLVIADEAAGIEDEILDVLEALLTSANVHLLYIGNPTRGNGNFFKSHKDSSFKKFKIDVFSTPNFRYNNIRSLEDLRRFQSEDELKELPLPYPELVTPLWAWGRMNAWGEESPIFKARVLAEFPEEGEDTLISLHLVEKAMEKEFTDDEWSTRPRCNVIGIDVARFGDDKSVCTAVDNTCMIDSRWHQGKDTMQTVGLAIAMFNDLGFDKELDWFVVDDTGVGGAVTDRLLELGYNVLPVNFSEKSEDERFLLIKAEMFWYARDLFREFKVKLLDRGGLLGEISSIKYEFNSAGKIGIVSKKKLKAQGEKSPDFADSLVLALWGTRLAASDSDTISDDDEEEHETIVGNIYDRVF